MLAALLALGLFAAVPQDPYPPECEEDDETPACAAALLAQRLSTFDAPPIEAEAATDAVVMRAFVSNGYGRDIVLISFEMRPDQPPMVVIKGRNGARLSHPISGADWDRAMSGSTNADRLLSPVSRVTNGDEIFICMHPWGAQLEMANTQNANGDTIPVRIKAERSCDEDGLALRYAFDLADIAVKAIPACADLDPDKHRNAPSRLSACLLLRGNTVAAASLMNERGEPPSQAYGHLPDEEEWARWLATDSTSRLDWAGEVFEESNVYRSGQPPRKRMSDIMLERAAGLKDLTIYQAEFGARDANNGWITGEVVYVIEGEDGRRQEMIADYRQEWSRGGGFGWRMDNWVVGAFRVLEPQDD